MARYTTEKTFAFNNVRDTRAIIVDESVRLSVWNGESFIEDENSPLPSGPYEIFTKGLNIKVTPLSGGYFIDENSQD